MCKLTTIYKVLAEEQAEATKFESIIYSYINSIPVNKGHEISIIGIKPKLEGLYVIYRIDNSIQRFARTISYSELAELTSKSKEN